MEDKINTLADLFREVGHAHHQAFVAVNGADPDWPLWYADYLLDKLPAHIGQALNREQTADLLLRLHQAHSSAAPTSDWADYYARRLLQA
ncbi:MAG: hypothetical protein HXY40_00335 [Chloroflexi bacterium]|nr:hypothetical protein [Chloroflexota bacterium]